MVTYPPDPLPLTREGGVKVREGAKAPSLKSLPHYGDGIKKRQREALPFLKILLPLSLGRRGGFKGERLIGN